MSADVETLVRALSANPAATALLFDFDGTLAPIVDDPAAARPRPGVAALLEVLAERYGVVGVVSGRPVSFLSPLLGPGVALSGLYGLETRVAGAVSVDGSIEVWRPAVSAAAVSARRFLGEAGPAATGATVEDKGLSLTVHFRRAPELGDAVGAWARQAAAGHGLVVRAAKASVELHPPVSLDKGTVVRHLVGDATTVAYFGDDLGDLPAFVALDDLGAGGTRTWKVAVASNELPPEVALAADLVLPAELVVAVLEGIAERSGMPEAGT